VGPIAIGILAVAAFATSTVSAILGMAGGISLLAVMALIVPAGSVVPIHGVVQLASNLTRTIAFIKTVHWPVFLRFAPTAAAGMAGAAMLWSGEKLSWFKPGIGLFIIAFLIWRHNKPKLRNPPMAVYPPLGLAAGFLSIWVGATGPFIAPWFLRDDFEKERVIATKAVCQTWLHFLKLPAFLALGYDYAADIPLLAILLVCVVGGTHFGKKLLEGIEEKKFVFYYECVLAAIAATLVVEPFFR
jgi:uncharacterized membrane protein YfcA